MNDSPSLVDRVFWPTVVISTLALGGFVTVVVKTAKRTSTEVAAIEPPVAHVENPPAAQAKVDVAPVAATLNAVTKSDEAPSTTLTEAPKVEVAVAAKPEASAAPEPAPEPAVTAETPGLTVVATPQKSKGSDEDSPYVVPTNKPYISSNDFGAPQRPQPPKKAPVKPPVPPAAAPAKPAVAVVKPAAPVAAPAAKVSTAMPMSDANTSASAMMAQKTPVYTLKDGRKIPALKVVDLGDSYGLKSANGQLITVLKEDVVKIEK